MRDICDIYTIVINLLLNSDDWEKKQNRYKIVVLDMAIIANWFSNELNTASKVKTRHMTYARTKKNKHCSTSDMNVHDEMRAPHSTKFATCNDRKN